MTEADSQLQDAVTGVRMAADGCQTLADIPVLVTALKQLAAVAAAQDRLGLQDATLLLEQHLEDVTASGELTADQLALLRRWPAQVQAYLDNAADKASSRQLLDPLTAPAWPAPMSEADAGVLLDMLARQDDDLLGELGQLAATIRAIDDEVPASLQQAEQALEQFAQRLGDAGETALQDCTLLLQQNIGDIAADGEPLSDVQKTLLTAWSGLAGNCLRQSDDRASRSALIQNLCQPHWPAALSHQDAAVLYELFGIEPPAEDEPAPPANDNVSPFPSPRSTTDEPAALASLDASLAQLETDNPTTLTHLSAPLAQLADSAAARDQLGLQDICLLLQQQLEDMAATATGLNDTQLQKVRQWSRDVRDYLTNPDNRDAAEALLGCLTDSCWPNPLDDSDVAILREMLGSSETATTTDVGETTTAAEPATVDAATDFDVSPAESEAVPAEPAAPTVTPSTPAPQPISLELVDMLASEMQQMHDEAGQLQTQLYADDLTPALRSDSLLQYAMRIERFGNACQAAELAGLQQACEVLQGNIRTLEQSATELNEQQVRLLCDWPDRVGAYLGAVGDAECSQALIDSLVDDAWPEPLLDDLRQPLIDLLGAAYISDDTPRDERLQTAGDEHVSLQLPDDINQELLDGLLEELPGQTETFSAAIQTLAGGNGGKKDLERAQRVAHTIKGAANTVGVRGIATLTHQIEDLLVILVEHERMPSQPLALTLVDAADCLEEMSEALLERGSAPAGARQTLQAVLDWVNRIETEGVAAMDNDAPVTTTGAAEPAADKPSDKPSDRPSGEAEEEQSASLRVPAHLIDDLLRLVGETLIVTAQLQEQVRQSSDQNQSLLEQHNLFQELVGELEQQVDVGGVAYKLNQSGDGEFDTLELEQYNELHTVTHRLVEAAADSQELDQDIGQRLRTLDELLVNQSRLQREVQELVMRTRMVPIKSIVPRLQRAVRQTCRVTGKQADLILEGTDTQLDSDILTSLVDPLMHMLRNAVDHGIETREERIRQNKQPSGTITLSCASEGTQVVLRCHDDGAGLDVDTIRRLAEKRGLIRGDENLSEDELRRLILRPGFSTRSETTQTSGRGIGMDIVATQLQAIKGSILIHSEPGQGTEFELRLPVSLMTTHGLLVRVRKQIMAISTRGIIQILHPDDGTISGDDDAPRYQLEDEDLELHMIDDLLQLPKDRRRGDRNSRPALLVREEALNCAVQIEQVIDSRDLVVKPLGPYLRKIRGIVGATILGDGSVVPVLDLPELIRTPLDERVEQGELTDTGIRRSLPVALVVDDSISARRTLAQVVRDAGYDVRTAKDGLEAMSLIEKKRPDIILTDLEMPRMNGIELASHLQANSDTTAIPVIMITSRSTEKHRHMAGDAGIDVYLNKPFSEDELLQHVHDLLEQSYSTSA